MNYRKNLLEETIKYLREYDKQPSDVLWVGRDYYDWNLKKQVRYKDTWDSFCVKADFEYNSGYGAVEIPDDIVIVGKDFWLERHQYDGSEWWEFKMMPLEPTETQEIDFDYHW